MLARNGLSVEASGHQRIVIHGGFQRGVGRVAVVARIIQMRRGRLRLHQFGQCKEGHSAPVAVIFAPCGDAVKIADVLELRQLVKILPRERDGIFHQAGNLQPPLGRRNLRLDAEVEHGKPAREVLAGREAVVGADLRALLARHLARPAFLAFNDIENGNDHFDIQISAEFPAFEAKPDELHASIGIFGNQKAVDFSS